MNTAKRRADLLLEKIGEFCPRSDLKLQTKSRPWEIKHLYFQARILYDCHLLPGSKLGTRAGR